MVMCPRLTVVWFGDTVSSVISFMVLNSCSCLLLDLLVTLYADAVTVSSGRASRACRGLVAHVGAELVTQCLTVPCRVDGLVRVERLIPTPAQVLTRVRCRCVAFVCPLVAAHVDIVGVGLIVW